MKKQAILFCLALLSVSSFAQQVKWIDLKYPQSGILGRGIQKINNGDPIWNPLSENSNLKFNTYTSADEIIEYRNKFRSFISKFFNFEKTKIKSITVKKLLVKSLDLESVQQMSSGTKFVYEGLTADTVIVTVSIKKKSDVDIEKLADNITNTLNVNSTEVVGKIIPFLDSMAYKSADSLTYRLTIYNPNVYYKVRFVEFKQITKVDWNRYWKYFSTNNNPSTTILTVDATGIKSKTKAKHPEFWGSNDNTSIEFRIDLKKEGDLLQLYLMGKLADFKGNWKQIRQIPYEMENGMQVWRMDREFVYNFVHNGVTKKVYVQCVAKQTAKNQVTIYNWVDSPGSIDNAQTYMQYPEIKFVYLNN
jgi:hypothetical protein